MTAIVDKKRDHIEENHELHDFTYIKQEARKMGAREAECWFLLGAGRWWQKEPERASQELLA